MSSITNTRFAKLAAGLVTAAMIVGLLFTATFGAQQAHALTESQIDSILNLLNSFGADQSTVDNVETSLRGGTPSGGGGSTGGSSDFGSYTFTRSLTVGDTGEEVRKVQEFINSSLVPGITVADSGVGSAGNETDYFGQLTAAAVTQFQNAYSAEVLAPVGLSAGTGYWGASSRAHANALIQQGGGSDNGGDTGGDTGGDSSADFTGLRVLSVDQPDNDLAPLNASRVAFTHVRVQAGDEDVTINDFTVRRTGLGSNDAFDGIILLDEDGTQLGNEKSLNSNNQTTVGTSVTINAGETMTFTVAGNMPSTASGSDGEQLTLEVTGINTNATIDGDLPIVGARHTVNESLNIGSVTVRKGANDPSGTSNREVGTSNYTFAGVRVTAGSEEDVRLKSIRWEQVGSASSADLDNVMVEVDGTEYETVNMGDYYTAHMAGDGLLIEEGEDVQISIKGDIVGGADREIDFDIEQASDIYVVGQDFNYGINPVGTNGGGTTGLGETSEDGSEPFYNGYDVTVETGSVVVSSTNDVPAGNIANGGDDVNLASFEFQVDGEAMTFDGITFTVATTSGAATGNEGITNVSLVDSNGNVLAGPADVTRSGDELSTAVLSDTVTLEAGDHTLFVRGDLDDDWTDGDQFTVSIDDLSTDIDDPEGETSGQSITLSGSATGKTQTVQAGQITVSPSTQLASKTIIDNSNDTELGRLVIDATDSGEDVRVRTLSLDLVTGSNAKASDLDSLNLIDEDGNELQGSGDYVDPADTTTGAATETLSFRTSGNGFVVERGTSMVVRIVGDVNLSLTPNSNTTYAIEPNSTVGNWSITGVNTGNTIGTGSLTLSQNGEAVLTVGDAGTLTASVDSSDPSERWYVAGSEGTIGVFEFDSSDETFDLTDLGLMINTASSSAADFQSISFWDGNTEVLTRTSPTFSDGDETFDFDAANSDFTVNADEERNLTVKAQFATIGTNNVGQSGNLVRVSTTSVASENQARGVESGSTVNILGNAGTTTGARYFRSLPTVALEDVQSTTLGNGTKELYRFSVTADEAGQVLLQKFAFNVATTGATATSFKLTQVDGGKAGQIVKDSGVADGDGNVAMTVDTGTYGQNYISVPAGDTITFRLEATLAGAGDDNDQVETELLGDSAYPALETGVMGTASGVSSNFVWSPRSTTSSITTNDWTNGFRVPGLEFDDLGTVNLSN